LKNGQTVKTACPTQPQAGEPVPGAPVKHLLAEGVTALSLEQLLAVVIHSRSHGESSVRMAHRLYAEYGARALTVKLKVREFAQLAELPLPAAARIAAAVELGRRLFHPGCSDFPVIQGPADVYAYVWEMRRLRQEHFRCLYLNTRHRVCGDRTVSIGSINSSLVHPREVYHGAVEYSANSLILIHNHPSGNLEPSRQDLRITRQLQEAGRLFSISVLDHIIVGREGYFSFKDHGRL